MCIKDSFFGAVSVEWGEGGKEEDGIDMSDLME